MKIQSLAIIFVIVMMPIMIVVSEYIQNQKQTLETQVLYDSRLITATYDAVKAFQLNTVNSTTSDVSSSKIRDIEASASAFFDSISNSFHLTGNNQDAIKNYVPAIVYTLYDGYYIYSPYTNDLGSGNTPDYTGSIEIDDGYTYTNGITVNGTKPYIYYSCRYTPTNGDFVITYTLDNYITIQGTVNGNYVNESGYLLDGVEVTGMNASSCYNDSGVDYDNIDYASITVTYNGVQIDSETLREVIIDEDGIKYEYSYIKINGTKYYLDETTNSVFYLLNDERIYGTPSYMSTDECIAAIRSNNSAKQYYIDAYVFTSWVRSLSALADLEAEDSENYDSTRGNYYIFKEVSSTNIEEESSWFNEQRLTVIRNSIETNLSIAIANYNGYSTSSNEFLMPELKEDEWDKILNNVSVISFLQGLPIGGKVYNGYAIVTNNENEEVVAENSIYIVTDDGYYHKVTDSDLLTTTSSLEGVFNVDLERKTVSNTTSGDNYYYYPQEKLACYYCIVNHERIASLETEDNPKTFYEYIRDCGNENLKKVYYTALGRERASSYKMANEI